MIDPQEIREKLVSLIKGIPVNISGSFSVRLLKSEIVYPLTCTNGFVKKRF